MSDETKKEATKDDEVQKGDQEPQLDADGNEITKGDLDDVDVVIDPNEPKDTTEPTHYGTKLVDVGGCSGLA